MNRIILVILTAVSLFISLNTLRGEEDQDKNVIRRFAMIAGSNNGGRDRIRLRYAVSDAKAVMNVMQKIGGVSPADSILLVEPDRNSFINGLKELNNRVNVAKKKARRVEIFFYYSGHSDEEAILPEGERVYYDEIGRAIKDMPVDVRIAVLDSCSSGAFTRIKGGRMRSPFLIDTSYDMKGYAFMTSSSSDEASQESDRIKGSFFTHYLVSGLRGAADMTQDSRITLSEAYQFAYSETLARTEKTLSGPQHPNYNIQMSGTGDVVMTDISKSTALMVIDKDVSGRLFIRDNKGNLVVELKKLQDRDIQIGLEDGKYSVINQRKGKVYEADIELVEGRKTVVSKNIFKKTDREYAIARGDEGEDIEYKVEPWHFSLFPLFEKNKYTIHNYVFNLFGSYSARLQGFEIGVGPSIVKEHVEGLQLTLAGNYNEGTTSGVQLAHFFNITREDLSGVQAASIFSIAGRDMKWFQFGGTFCWAGKNMTGGQLSSLFNYTGAEMAGVQVSAIINHAKENAEGAQVSAIFNNAGKNMTGAQVSAILNRTGGELYGTQVSAVTNISDGITGAQVGLVNIADDVDGIQLGLVNIADELNGASIGLVNISENGSIDAVAWGSNLMAANLGVRFRANYLYTIISGGWNNLYEGIDQSLAFGFYFGGHVPVGDLYVNIDAGQLYIDNDSLFSNDEKNDQSALQGRLIVGYNIAENISVFAGGGASYIYDEKDRDDKDSEEREDSDFNDGMFEPLILAGVQYVFYGMN